RAIPEWTGRADRADQLGVAELRPERQHDVAIVLGKPPTEFTHAGLVTEEADHALVARHRALVHLEAFAERDPHPGIDRRIDLPVGDDAVAMGRPRSDRPAQAVPKAGATAVGDGNEPRPNVATRRRYGGPAGIWTDITDFCAMAEFDARIAAERISEPGVEVQPPDAESGLITATSASTPDRPAMAITIMSPCAEASRPCAAKKASRPSRKSTTPLCSSSGRSVATGHHPGPTPRRSMRQ